MPSVRDTIELYILDRERLPAVLIPDRDGVLTFVEPQPALFRAAYVRPEEDLEMQINIARSEVGRENCGLLAFTESQDGPPHRSAMYFDFDYDGTRSGVAWRDAKTTYFGGRARRYGVTTSQGAKNWLFDARYGRPGYFLTGDPGDASLWGIVRIETDALTRSIFTLSPVRPASSCPVANFSAIGDPLRAAELGAQYNEFCTSVVRHNYRDVVTKARNIVEGLVAARLRVQGRKSDEALRDDLYEDLKVVRRLLEDPKTRDSCGWTDLEYHLAHKIRLVHARTHVGQTVASGRPLPPEFALSVVEDLLQLLRTWGFCAP